MSTKIANYLNAAYPLLLLATYDETRILSELAGTGRRRFTYSAAQQLHELPNVAEPVAQGGYREAFTHVANIPNSVLIVRDMQHTIQNAPVYRALLDCADQCKRNGVTIIGVAPSWKLPAELSHAAPVVDIPLPTAAELAEPLARIVAAAELAEPAAELAAELAGAACGLTCDEAENSYALSLVETGGLSAQVVNREKMRLIQQSGCLFVHEPMPITSIGGLGLLKAYIRNEVLPVASDDQLRVRGFALAGLPGLGKSLAAKVLAALMGVPLIRFDVAALRDKFVGGTESNARQATALLDAFGAAVLWIDEADKSMGTGGGTRDGGATAGAFGHLLTWLQEHSNPITTVITCNDYQALPAELTRAGRFDERFYIDLPTQSEREQIAAVHLARFGCEVSLSADIAARSRDYTGAEIEQLIKSAARLSARAITAEHLETAASSIKPVSQTGGAALQEFRTWARANMRLANDAETNGGGYSRKLTTGGTFAA